MTIPYFDYVAIIISVILFSSMVLRKMMSGRANILLATLLALIILAAVLDCWSEASGILIPVAKSNVLLREIACYGYFFIRNLTPLFYQLFICAITDTWHILKKNRWMKLLIAAPYTAVCCVLVTNPFHHLVFYYDENCVYHRGPLLFLLYVCAFLYLLFGMIYLFKYKKQLTYDKFVALVLMYPLNVISNTIQLLFPAYLVELFMNSLTMLLIMLVIQRPEEIINPIIGVRNFIAYTSDMKKAYFLQKPVRIIFVKLVNYRALLSLLEYETFNLFIKNIALDLSQIYKEEHLPVDVYYLENGLFAIVTERELKEKLMSATRRVSAALTGRRQFGQFRFELDTCVCMLRCPEDIHDYERLLSFGISFHTYLPAGGEISIIGDGKDRRMFLLRGELESIISNAISENRFEMYYQPIYSVKEKKFSSAEALIRLQDDDYGFISPELFITEAEKNGMIVQIGDFVLDDVCRFLSESKEKGMDIGYIEINLSMSQCIQEDLKQKVMYYIDKYHLKPDQINLEITETTANTAQKLVDENLQLLSEEGISFSLDDYGIGYSNISRIVSLPLRIVKLDKSLVDLVNDERIRIILKNTIHMLKEIGLEIVAEGVETEEILQQFIELGCDYIQGFYFSKPLPEQKFVEFMQKNTKEQL